MVSQGESQRKCFACFNVCFLKTICKDIRINIYKEGGEACI